jgi:hypothetical protein
MGLMLGVAILLSLAAAVVLDFFSYFASAYGVGLLLVTTKKSQIQKVRKDRTTAIIVTLLLCTFVIAFQMALVFFRFDQIVVKKEVLKAATHEYEVTLQNDRDGTERFSSDRSRRLYIESAPKYAGSEMMDYMTMIVPFATTILSFVIGLINVGPYNESERLKEEKRNKFLKEERTCRELVNEAESIISELQLAAGGYNGLKGDILKGKDDNSFLLKLNDNLKNQAPEIYKKQIERLNAILNEKAKLICFELSTYADDPSLILEMDLLESDKFKDIVTKLKELDENLYKSNSLDETSEDKQQA